MEIGLERIDNGRPDSIKGLASGNFKGRT